MASTLSAKKRIRQNLKARARNRWRLRTLRLAARAYREKLARGSHEEAAAALRHVCQLADKTASKGVIHKNTAARIKSRLNKRLRAKVQAQTA